MKIFLFLLLILPVGLLAQVEKGKYYLNLSMNLQNNAVYSNINNTTKTTSNYQLPLSKLSFGKLINNSNGLCIIILGSINTSEIYSIGKNQTFGLGIGHWYLHPINEHWGFLLNSEFYGRYGRISPYAIKEDYNMNFNEWTLTSYPGVYAVFLKKLLVQAGINFFSASVVNISNDDDVPMNLKKEESHKINVKGILPASVNFNAIQIRLSYFIN